MATDQQKLQLAEQANELFKQRIKDMLGHCESLKTLVQDKENIIENLVLRYDLGIITQDQTRQRSIVLSDEIPRQELQRKAAALAQKTILENFELREMVTDLRDENFHLRNEIYENQDKINRQVLQINRFEKNLQNRMKCKKDATNQHLQLWLRCRHLLAQLNTNDTQFMKLCAIKIFQMFGFKEIMNAFIDKADTNKLETLFKQMKRLKVHYDEKYKPQKHKNTTRNQAEIDDESDCDMVQDTFVTDKHHKKRNQQIFINYMDTIPNELLSHIYGYLNRESVCKNMKRVNSRMAIVALSEMLKYSVGVFNANELLQCEHNGLGQKYSRYNSSMSFAEIFERLGAKYDIPMQQQLLYRVDEQTKLPKQYIDHRRNRPISTEDMSEKEFMLFDKRKVVRLKCNYSKPVTVDMCENINSDGCKVVFLKYFNIEKQLMEIVSVLLIDPSVKEENLSHYIENQFINVRRDTEWYRKLSSYLGEMGGWIDKKLIFFNAKSDAKHKNEGFAQKEKIEIWSEKSIKSIISAHYSNENNIQKKAPKINNGTILIFQLNPSHPWFRSTNVFNKKGGQWFNDVKMLMKYRADEAKIKKQSEIRKRKTNRKKKPPQLSNLSTL